MEVVLTLFPPYLQISTNEMVATVVEEEATWFPDPRPLAVMWAVAMVEEVAAATAAEDPFPK